MTEDALALFAPVFFNLIMELVKGFDRRLRLLQLLHLLLHIVVIVPQVAGLSPIAVKLLRIVVNRDLVRPDLGHDGLEYTRECLGAGEDDFATRLADICVVVELIIPFSGWESNVPGGKNVDLVAVADIRAPVPSACCLAWTTICRPSTGVRGPRTPAAASSEEVDSRSLGPAVRVTMDSLNSTSTSVIWCDSRICLQPTAVVWASLRERLSVVAGRALWP